MTTGKYGEPWNVQVAGVEYSAGHVSRCDLEDEDGIGVTMFDIMEDNDVSFARRAVACVNACEGIEDPADLRRQRDILLKACKDLQQHQRIVAGTARSLSTTSAIVQNALAKIGERGAT